MVEVGSVKQKTENRDSQRSQDKVDKVDRVDNSDNLDNSDSLQKIEGHKDQGKGNGNQDRKIPSTVSRRGDIETTAAIKIETIEEGTIVHVLDKGRREIDRDQETEREKEREIQEKTKCT